MNHLYPVRPLADNTTDGLLEAPTEGQVWHNKSNNHLYVWSGTEWVPLSSRADYAANWGQLTNGDQIPKPVASDGYVFEYNECIWSTSPSSVAKFDAFLCSADENGYVTIQYRPVGASSFVDGVANYIIVGIRGNRNKGVILPPPVPSVTPSPTPVAGLTPTPTPSVTVSPSVTPTVTPTHSVGAPSPSVTPTHTVTPTRTPTVTPTQSAIAPMVVTITDPESSSDASKLSAICNKGNYSSLSRDTGYLTCGASSLSTCDAGGCAPEPGDNGVGPVMRVSVTGGQPPYTVKIQNFAEDTSYTLTNAAFGSGSSNWTLGTNWVVASGIAHIDTDDLGVGDTYDSDIINNTEGAVVPGTIVTATAEVWGVGADNNQAAALIQWLNSSHANISKVVGNYSDNGSSGTHITSSVTATAPAGAAYVRVGARGQARTNGACFVDNVTWSLANTTYTECFFVGGVNIVSLPHAAIVKTYSLPTAGSATPIISLNGICGSTNFFTRGTFDIVVTDDNGSIQTFNKAFDITRTGTYVGGSGGGGGGCVTRDMAIYGYARADEVQVGDVMRVINPLTYEMSEAFVSRAEIKPQPCVRITTESGITLECSTTAPISDENGVYVYAPMLEGVIVPLYDNGEMRTERVISVKEIGVQEIVFITCENNFFLAGTTQNKYFLHHNTVDSEIKF